ncbi:MAG: hypothetical protein D6720_04200 [Gammaproteobacteria bacterium]|nr:MAG: hypothetical protein D6720_04200 [Gammaproteobacteria bacterium]
MRFKALLLTTLLASTQAMAIEFPQEVIESIDGTRVVAFISQKDIDAAGTWEPLRTPPPVTFSQALESVAAALAKRGVPTASIRLASAELKEFPHQPGHWHYLIRLKKGTDRSFPRFFVVLTSGKVVAAIMEPEAYK